MRGRDLVILGVPSSAGAFACGQERAPAALREAGLVERLAAAGDVLDLGDLPEFRWHPDRAQPRAQHAARVAETAAGVRDAVAGRLSSGHELLVLGGDCTVGVGTVAGSRLAGGRTGLVYLDMHADLNVPSSVVDGALDWMGMAHMLGVEGCLPGLRDLASPFVPMLDATEVVMLGHEHSQATDWERSVIAERSIAVVAAEALRADPAAAAERALAQLADATRVIVRRRGAAGADDRPAHGGADRDRAEPRPRSGRPGMPGAAGGRPGRRGRVALAQPAVPCSAWAGRSLRGSTNGMVAVRPRIVPFSDSTSMMFPGSDSCVGTHT